jgi:predicted nuclease of predicted toxin-antitoxin system
MLRILFDENLNQRIVRGLRRRVPSLDYVVAQDVGLQGREDPHVLAWAAEEQRILITHDLKTIPRFAYERVSTHQAMPGVIAVPDTLPIGQAIEEIAIIVECSAQSEWENQVVYLPL